MKLQFKVQQYQTEAVDAVVRCFDGQPRRDPMSYLMDPGRHRSGQGALYADSGLRNAEIELPRDQLLKNIQAVQRAAHLPRSTVLVSSKAAAPGAPNLDVEMETGTGKTYVYIKTIMELHKRYGWGKYIVVVPSVAIREGVKKSFDITAEHFQQTYGTKPRSFIYNSTQLHELERFSSDAGVQAMIINIQAFNATGKDQRRIYDELDDFQSRRPIDVIAANRPIVIIDEPQKMGAAKSLEALAKFNALMVLRYSATHRVEHNKVHRLDALDAYNEKLVKKIAVRGITVRGLAGSTAYLYLDSIEVKAGTAPVARVELEVQTKSAIKRKLLRVTKGARLHDLANGVEAYRDLVVTDINAINDTMELSNGDIVIAGQLADRDVTEDSKRRIQIREAIQAHVSKERELHSRGIKVLTLFFIDEVAKYRDYSREDTLGEYARVFEEEYVAAVADLLNELPLEVEGAPSGATGAYRRYLQRDEVRKVHAGYFSIDKKTKRDVDPAVAKRGEEAGQATDTDAYDLILKDKERLLSLAEPVRFLFSHSALREGWDNPNVFVMGMLKKSDNTISRRQEVGRGLRLAVDQRGERMDTETVGEQVHDINELTVVTDESYTSFVDGLQKEIAESLSARPRRATAEYFAGRTVTDIVTGEEREISLDEAKQLKFWLTQNGFIDYDDELTDKWRDRAALPEIPELPEALQPYFYQLAGFVDALDAAVPSPADGRKLKKLEPNANLERAEFQQLWGRINHKAVYQVQFDSDELVRKCVAALDLALKVAALQYVVQSGVQSEALDADGLTAGAGFAVTSTSTHTETATASSQVKYDLLGEVSEKTQLTRQTAAAILGRVTPATFAQYRLNPEQFITEAARIINEQKATVIIEHLAYDTLSDRFDTGIFTENQTKQDISNSGGKLKRHIYDYVVTDSAVERAFVAELDTSVEVAVYAKLPRGFFIPTPVGNYNPDWAIAFKEGSVKHVYFVAETKGSLSSLQLRPEEQAKIDCARKFFASLNEKRDGDVTYGVVTDYGKLMQLVTS